MDRHIGFRTENNSNYKSCFEITHLNAIGMNVQLFNVSNCISYFIFDKIFLDFATQTHKNFHLHKYNLHRKVVEILMQTTEPQHLTV